MKVTELRILNYEQKVRDIFKFIKKEINLEENQEIDYRLKDGEEDLSILEISLYTDREPIYIPEYRDDWDELNALRDYGSVEVIFKYDIIARSGSYNKKMEEYMPGLSLDIAMDKISHLSDNNKEILFSDAI